MRLNVSNFPITVAHSYNLSRTPCFSTKNHLFKELKKDHTKGNLLKFLYIFMIIINQKFLKKKDQPTFDMVGSFQGPLSDLIQPPRLAQLQVPPRNSGSSLSI